MGGLDMRADRKRRSIGRIAIYAALILLSLLNVFPFFWMLRSSFMTKNEIFAQPMRWLPKTFLVQNYSEALIRVPFLRYFLNSLLVVAVNLVGKVLSSSLVAFGFARIDFKGKNLFFAIVIATMMIPWSVLLIPQFIL